MVPASKKKCRKALRRIWLGGKFIQFILLGMIVLAVKHTALLKILFGSAKLESG